MTKVLIFCEAETLNTNRRVFDGRHLEQNLTTLVIAIELALLEAKFRKLTPIAWAELYILVDGADTLVRL